VDFLSHNIDPAIVEELSYALKPEVVGMGQKLVWAGQEAD